MKEGNDNREAAKYTKNGQRKHVKNSAVFAIEKTLREQV
jgi:hypothetical protein